MNLRMYPNNKRDVSPIKTPTPTTLSASTIQTATTLVYHTQCKINICCVVVLQLH